jgi:hypothetical protein
MRYQALVTKLLDVNIAADNADANLAYIDSINKYN